MVAVVDEHRCVMTLDTVRKSINYVGVKERGKRSYLGCAIAEIFRSYKLQQRPMIRLKNSCPLQTHTCIKKKKKTCNIFTVARVFIYIYIYIYLETH